MAIKNNIFQNCFDPNDTIVLSYNDAIITPGSVAILIINVIKILKY